MKLVLSWLRELCPVAADADAVAAGLARRGFEVAAIDRGAEPAIDFEITANRPDCLSVIGLAREASAAWGVAVRESTAPAPEGSGGTGAALPSQAHVTVSLDDPDNCPRYCAQVFSVQANGLAPAWMRSRLEAAGVRSISALVDVTNYVMLEIGQPLHAFDCARLDGAQLRVRTAAPGERIRTLDGVDRVLAAGMLVIADRTRAQAVAGVMGGAESEIGATTRTLVLESACFAPASVRRTSKRLNLKTEASMRFERGADIDAAPAGLARAAELFEELGLARAIGPAIDCYPAPRPRRTIDLRAERITRVLGMAVPSDQVAARLRPLGFAVEVRPGAQGSSAHAWRVQVPAFRVDVQREIDLIEEVARHDGYASLPATFPALSVPPPEADPRTVRDATIRRVLIACGLSEAMTFSFIEAAAAAPFADGAALVPVANPLSEKFAVMRPSLLPGLIDAAAHNRRRDRADVRLFEVGTRVTVSGEARVAAGVWAGAGVPPHWSAAARAVDFFDVKGVVAALAQSLGGHIVCEPATAPAFVDGRAAEVRFRRNADRSDAGPERTIGRIGQIAPRVLAARGWSAQDVLYAFELTLDTLEVAGDLRTTTLPRFPAIVRDLSILVDAALPAAAVRGTIRSAAPETLAQIVEFDRYRGKGVPEDRVSLSWRLTFRSPERTLTDADADAAMTTIVEALARTHGAARR